MSAGEERLSDLLAHIQTNLEGTLGLEALCHRARLSPAQFHRLFKARLGETPAKHVERLRVELAAFRLLLHDASILEIAIECGFESHETFIRAFRRRFDVAPGEYRRETRTQGGRGHRRKPGTSAALPGDLSPTRVTRMRGLHIAYLRHYGPYEDVPLALFDELADWARGRRLTDPIIWLGIGLDAPGITSPAKLRFDAALAVAEPFPSGARVSCRWLEGGTYALTTHAGSFETLPAAYGAIFNRLRSIAGHRPIGLPAIELYRPAALGAFGAVEQTDIYLPIEPIRSD